MKKSIAILCIIILMVPLFASAVSIDEFSRQCDMKILTDTDVYVQDKGEMLPVGILTAGTVCADMGSLLGYRCIQYLKEGQVTVGWIRDGACEEITVNRPRSTPVPIPPTLDELLAGYGLTAGSQIETVWLGTSESLVSADGKELLLPTYILVYESEIPEERRIAAVNAPKTGKASLRSAANAKASVLKEVIGGTVLLPTDFDNGFVKTIVDGKEGWIKETSLLFYGERRNIGKGIVILKENEDGSKSVNVRSKAAPEGVKLTEWATGTKVILLSENGNYYEAEANGITGFIQKENIRME